MLGAEMTNLTGVKVTIFDQIKRERYHASQNELQITICTNQTDKGGEICSEINYPDVAIPTGNQALVVWLISSILQLANTRCQYQ
ncbi:hypothetical protein T07_1748 [Trichinella nelsoni]|uniref:Uncharacterized protein n=1 Tax=Trichinella nelsoni TaxID=6336 RepID=A0A0V0RN41_9BILA|nr:hypothetical protein T07_1748 [Trichinella nelsoni]